ncbi:hypothetical protein AB3Y13_03055 [Vibrio alginolyticus]
MLTILLVVLALTIFWLLFSNSPAFEDPALSEEQSWVGPTENLEEWQAFRSHVFEPFSSQTSFYAVAYFANFVAAANAISWSTVFEGNYSFLISRFGSYFIVTSYDVTLLSGFVALAFFVINWQLAMHCAGIFSQYLVRLLVINRIRFAAISLIFCSYFAYLLTISIFWLFHDSYSIWQGLKLSPVFLFLALVVVVALPSKRKEPQIKD